MRVYFRLEVIGREHIPQNGPVILAPTHRSRWDTLALYCGTYRPLRFLTSHDEFAGTQNWFMRRMGAFPINTRRPTPGAMRHCRELLLGGQPLVIFPEGNLFYYPPNQVHPLKPGTAWLALDCQERLPEVTLTIVPVRLNYSDRVLRLRSRVRVEVGEPIPLKPYLDLPRKQGMARLTQDLQQALGDEVNTSTAELGHPPRD
jgi:1-acyl-sn-glycerol-3-phosphate acyltransferase